MHLFVLNFFFIEILNNICTHKFCICKILKVNKKMVTNDIYKFKKKWYNLRGKSVNSSLEFVPRASQLDLGFGGENFSWLGCRRIPSLEIEGSPWLVSWALGEKFGERERALRMPEFHHFLLMDFSVLLSWSWASIYRHQMIEA